jgi:DNA recombination protein RmuC
MEPLLFTLIFFLAGAVIILLLRTKSSNTNGIQSLVSQLNDQQGQQLQQVTNLVLQQLSKNQEAQDRSSNMMHNRIDAATKVVSDVQGKLLQLEEANKRIFDLGKDISSLQKILQAPKLRGGMGEIWLAELIAQIIPSDRYKLQYSFKSGEICDAVILLRDGMILAIDSKFSLENFVKMLEAEEVQKIAYKKMFTSDIKKRIDEIAKKYIVPHEGTLEFAFMYVPAENVYYQAFIQDDDNTQLLNYAFNKHVIPVSPSSFYAYLQVILFGLRGMEIERGAKEIQRNLAGLHGEFNKFKDIYEKVGVHLRHAQQSYELTDKKVVNLENKLEQISTTTQTQLDPPEPVAISVSTHE